VLRQHRHLCGDLVFPRALYAQAEVERDEPWLTDKMLVKPFRRVWRAAGLPGIRLHDMRHSFASQLVIRGVPLKAVQELLGHQHIGTTMRYAHLAPGARQEFVEVLDVVSTPGGGGTRPSEGYGTIAAHSAPDGTVN